MRAFGLGLLIALAFAAPQTASAAKGSAAQPRLPLSAGKAHASPARDIDAARTAGDRVQVAMADTPAPTVNVAEPRRIKTHKRFARLKKDRALQFSETGAAGYKTMIAREASANGVPEALAHAVVQIESRYNPHVTNGANIGLMQIQARTARGMGFSGSPSALLQPEVNLRYGMKYLGLAYRDSHGDVCQTVTRYQSGHYSGHISRAYCNKAKAIMANR